MFRLAKLDTRLQPPLLPEKTVELQVRQAQVVGPFVSQGPSSCWQEELLMARYFQQREGEDSRSSPRHHRFSSTTQEAHSGPACRLQVPSQARDTRWKMAYRLDTGVHHNVGQVW